MSTLPSVGVAKEALTLSSWIVVPPEGGLWDDFSVEMNTFNSNGQIEGDYLYLDDGTAGGYGVDPGWYTTESVINGEPLSASGVNIPYGSGVQIGSNCGATITFAGEVAGEESFDINDESVGGYTWTGNTSPINLTLADISITPPEGGLWDDFSIEMNTFNANGQIEGDYLYLDEGTAGGYGVDPGWYTTESVINGEPLSAGSVIVMSGEMFQIGSNCGATITIPSAL